MRSHNSTSYKIDGLNFESLKTPNFTPKYNFKFEETDRTEDNLMGGGVPLGL